MYVARLRVRSEAYAAPDFLGHLFQESMMSKEVGMSRKGRSKSKGKTPPRTQGARSARLEEAAAANA